jgi:prevent-host-death family protein
MATEVGIRELKNRTSRVIDRVADGEVITVTRRGKAVARIVPTGMPLRIAQLVAEGKVNWSGRPLDLLDPIRLEGSGPLASDYVIEGRR